MDFEYLSELARELSRRVVQEGVGTTLHKGARYLIGLYGTNPRQDEFDLKRGIYTSRSEPVWMLGIQAAAKNSAVKYEAVDHLLLEKVLGDLEDDRSKAAFLDLGCGKGRALIMAAEGGYRDVIGIDLSAKLVSRARKNLKKLQLHTVTVLQGDAADFPFDVPNLTLFMYNPFDGDVLRRVVENISSSTFPPKYIIYFNPIHAEMIKRTDRYELTMDTPQVAVWKIGSH